MPHGLQDRRAPEEVEHIIDALTRTTKQQQLENEHLKKNSVSAIKYMDAMKENKKLKEKLIADDAETKKTMEVHSLELDRLRRALQGETSANAALRRKFESTPGNKQSTEKEAQFRKIENDTLASATIIAQLTARIESLQVAALGSSTPVHVLHENKLLKDEIAHLRGELDAFDPAFFEELEDLKNNYKDALGKIKTFENGGK